jgi:hypothetical protein
LTLQKIPYLLPMMSVTSDTKASEVTQPPLPEL